MKYVIVLTESDGKEIMFNNAKQLHDEIVNKYNCSCHCSNCSEEDPFDCIDSEIEQCYPEGTKYEWRRNLT